MCKKYKVYRKLGTKLGSIQAPGSHAFEGQLSENPQAKRRRLPTMVTKLNAKNAAPHT